MRLMKIVQRLRIELNLSRSLTVLFLILSGKVLTSCSRTYGIQSAAEAPTCTLRSARVFSQPGTFSALVAGALALIMRARIIPVDSILPNPLGYVLVECSSRWSTALQLGSSLKQSSIASSFCCALNRGLVLAGLVMDQSSEGHGVPPFDLFVVFEEPHGLLWIA